MQKRDGMAQPNLAVAKSVSPSKRSPQARSSQLHLSQQFDPRAGNQVPKNIEPMSTAVTRVLKQIQARQTSPDLASQHSQQAGAQEYQSMIMGVLGETRIQNTASPAPFGKSAMRQPNHAVRR